MGYGGRLPLVEAAAAGGPFVVVGLVSIGSGNVAVSAAAGGGWEVRLTGTLAAKYQSAITANGAGLTGGTSPALAVATVNAGGTPGAPQLASALAQLGSNLIAAGRHPGAEVALRESLVTKMRDEPNDWRTFYARALLGGALAGQKKYDKAEPELLAGYEGMKARVAAIPPPVRRHLPEAADQLVALYESAGKPAEVKKWRAERAKYPFVAPPPPAGSGTRKGEVAVTTGHDRTNEYKLVGRWGLAEKWVAQASETSGENQEANPVAR